MKDSKERGAKKPDMFRRNRAGMIAWSRSWGRKRSLRRWEEFVGAGIPTRP